MPQIQGDRGTLVLVDYQERLLPSIHTGDAVVAEALFLARLARLLGVRVLGTEQNPAGLGPNLPGIRELCEQTLAKMHFDACKDGLLDLLESPGPDIGKLVIAGCEAHVCLLQTALGLRKAGFNVHVVADACGSRLPIDHQYAMRRLEKAGVVLVSAEMLAFEWLDSCADAAFKPALALIKQRSAGP